MDRVSFTAPRRVVGAICLLACLATLSTACTAGTGSPPAQNAVNGAGASANVSVNASASANSNAAGGGGGAASPSAVASSAAAGSGGAGGSGGSGGGASPAASAAAQGSGASTCLVRYLHGDVGLSQGAMGSTYVDITFKNLNNAPCTLYGYPGVSFGAGTPVNQVGQAANRDPAVGSKLITLAPGGYAYATLRITNALNYPAATCKPSPTTWLLVYPPNTSNLLYVPYNSNACTGNVVTLTVQAVQAGTGG